MNTKRLSKMSWILIASLAIAATYVVMFKPDVIVGGLK